MYKVFGVIFLAGGAFFVFGTLEHVPVIGESIDFDGWRFTVVAVHGRRIRTVRIALISGTEAETV